MKTAIIAHRGFSSRYLENTLPAIRAALQLGVDFVEVDVHETRDGQLVVFHDYRLDRLLHRHKRVREVTLAEMKALNPQIPSLREVLRLCRGKARMLVEIKRADPSKVAAEIQRCGMERSAAVLSRSDRHLGTLAAQYPRIRRFLLATERWPRRLSFPIEGVAAAARLVRCAEAVRRIHRRGWKLFVWTVNRRRQMETLIRWGVDGLITNYPERAKSCLAPR